ncbi:phosphatase PAP2 family protein [Lacibacter sp. MH-610]|uniref:phosphatase PAP2 family protein n=1 Tax=Lacibacter sp. MH-610 TaxID=3020883 RepID=UPI0038916210
MLFELSTEHGMLLIEKIDRYIFILIHRDADQQWLDPFMLMLRHPYTWIPFYTGVALYAVYKTGKKSIVLFFGSALSFVLNDIVSAKLLKPFFERPRPCHTQELQSFIRPVIDCGGLYSFPSTHACNHFGLAVVWFLFFKTYKETRWTWLFVWASAVCYAQVYVGKHFPLDVLFGASTGTLIGMPVFFFVQFFYRQSASKSRLNPDRFEGSHI